MAFLSLEKVLMVYAIMITNQCNFHCGHCMVESTSKFNLISDEITNRFIDIVKKNSNSSEDAVYIIGGEPTLHMDYVEKLIEAVRNYCKDIMLFTNGRFLLDTEISKRVKKLDILVRISNDKYHRLFWNDKLAEAIFNSGYIVEEREDDYEMIPVGRAYEEYKDLKYNLGCSLLTGFYDDRYPNNHRCMVMQDGRINLYCAAIESSLANVLEDVNINYDLLVEREKILHNYLLREVFKCYEDTFMAKLCNECPNYKVTDTEIFYKGEHVAYTKDYRDGSEDLFGKLK